MSDTYGTDSGPACWSCGGTVYSYTLDAERETALATCIACRWYLAFIVRRVEHTVKAIRRAHEKAHPHGAVYRAGNDCSICRRRHGLEITHACE